MGWTMEKEHLLLWKFKKRVGEEVSFFWSSPGDEWQSTILPGRRVDLCFLVRCNLIRIKGKIRERGYHLKYRTEVTVCIRNAETLWAFFQLGLRMQADWMLTSREEFGRLLPGNCTSPNLKRADHLLHSQPLKNWWLQVTAYYFSQFCEIVLLPLEYSKTTNQK